MHASRYTIVEHDGQTGEYLLYNTANGAFAALDETGFAAFEAADGACARQLADLGFLTEATPEQELEAYRVRMQTAWDDHSTFGLSLIPTYACNFKCPYCYEQGHNNIKGKMDGRLMDTIMAFIEAHYAEHAFAALEVQWYGGDPSLALDAVAEMSARMIAWCEEREIAYNAMMLTNANVIGEAEAQVIADCRITSIMLTIDGPEEIHNQRRVAANDTNSYQCTIQAARHLREHGITLQASMNVDRITWPLFAETRDKLLTEEGIYVNPGRLCDYGHTYGQPPFAPPTFDLLDHDEFCRLRLEQFASEPHTALEMREMLRPIDHFCTGQSGDYFVIDCLGDVYHCDGWVGDKSFVRFNLFDGPSAWKPSEITFDASRDEKCSACEIMPICLGSCIWERTCTGMPCHPMKDHMSAYLRIYRSCFDVDADADGGIAVLANPIA